MTDEEFHDLLDFAPEQGAKIEFDHTPGTRNYTCKVWATDAGTALKALALLVIRLTGHMGCDVTHVLAKLAVMTMDLMKKGEIPNDCESGGDDNENP